MLPIILSNPLLLTSASELPSSATRRPSLVTSTASFVASCNDRMIADISAVAEAALSARFLISSATTPKALPASPARAASIEALSERRFVLSEIRFIVSIIRLISFDLFPRSFIDSADLFMLLRILERPSIDLIAIVMPLSASLVIF